jgi:FixJ family two-component response regulator
MQALNITEHPRDPYAFRMIPRSTVFIVDGDLSAREALEELIRDSGWQVECFCSAEEFLARPRSREPGCVILDVSLPQLDGFALQEMIADRREVPVIFVTRESDVRMTVRAMKAGAVDFLAKPCNGSALLCAVQCALDRSRGALDEEATLRSLKVRFDSLTPRERQVLSLVVSGRLNKQAAAQLDISEITVKAHRGKVMRKMEADSIAHLVTMASQLRIEPAFDRLRRL